ncbi:MAG: DUF1592 domain-containing protein [Gammaproteobacteria bacterium]|nr:DUF1592 domain-containing protein [Gammaproteobacteria bacterium]MDE0246329.1 DUF1592 domain-containing protein [Gammaproteobacteria bacterium]
MGFHRWMKTGNVVAGRARAGRTTLLSVALGGGVAAAFLGALAAPLPSASRAPAGQDPFTASDVQEVVDTYCLVCHDDASRTGGLSLESIDFTNPGAHAEALEAMIKKLQARMMPPAEMPRPDLAVYDSVTTWLGAELDRAWADSPDPGRVTPVHRMNRLEYNNAINDLLGIDVDVMALLPGDPTADGSFDNMAAALPFSTAHMERYLSVARQVTRLAVGMPPPNAEVTTYEIPLHIVQDWRQGEDLPFGSRGGLGVTHHFPVDGEYLFRIRLRTNWQDYIMGMGWPQQLEVRLDGALLERFTIGGEAPGDPSPMSFSGPGEPGSIDWEEYMLTGDERLEVRVPVQAGPHVVAVSYVREHLEPEDIPQPVQRGRLLANDEVYMNYQQVQSLEIGGPYGATAVAGGTPSRAALFTCQPDEGAEARACATEVLSRAARRAYRRPVSEADLQTLLRFYDDGREKGGSFDAGIQFALEFLLSDPDFLIRVYDEPQGVQPAETYRLSDREIASRLSFFLWSTLPDETLLRLADEGRLSNGSVLEAQVRRMLADPRAVETLVEDFAAQWLNLRRIPEVEVNPEAYPNFDETLLEAFRQETELFIGGTIRSDRSIIELLDADYTYLNERLARHYGVPGVYGSRYRRVALPNLDQRGGLLAHGGLLAVTSYPGRTSPVLRGKWLLDNILGTPPAPPPPSVPILPEAEAGALPASIRERLAQHRDNPVCSSCHIVIDPLGFALENYDVIGGWRTFDEGGNPVDPRGTYAGGVEFGGFSDLRAWMLERPERFAHTLTEKLMAYALGRRIEYYDQPSIRQIVRTAAEEDYTWSSLVVGITGSPAFLMSTGGTAEAQ